MAKHGHKGKKGKGGNFQSDFLKHPGSLVKPLTPKRLRKEEHAAQRLQFGPEGRQLHAEQRASALQQRRIADWFPQYQAQIAQAQQQSRQGYNQAVQGVQQDTGQAQDYAESLRQRMRAESEQSAAQRGATYDPTIDATAQAANLSRGQLSQNVTGMLRGQGANQNAYFSDKKRIAKGEELNQLLREAARGRSVNADLRDLASRKGAFATDYEAKARPQERDFYLGLLQARLGNQSSKRSASTSRSNAQLSAAQSNRNSQRSAASSRASTRQSNINSQRSARTSRQNSRRSARNSGSSGGKGDKGRKPIKSSHVAHAISYIRSGAAGKNWSTKPGQEIIDAMLAHSTTLTPREAKKAYRRLFHLHGGKDHSGGR